MSASWSGGRSDEPSSAPGWSHPGWSLPGYDVEGMLGFGATGEVWRAREVATGDVVALKRLREGADPAALEALRREATLLRTIDTPYVVRLRAVVGDVLVLDHAPGGSLAALLTRRGVLDPGEVVTVAAPLAAALACAHRTGLVHGDVSPANVLFTADGMPLLADLGVARVAGQALTRVDGTAEYVDPAVAAGGAPDAASDVWALAALCHHLLAGSPPHDGVSAADVLHAAVAGERAPLGLLAPSAPRALVAAVEAGLVADPALRPDATAFCSLLRRAHAAAPVRLTGGPAPYAPVRETHVVRAAAPPAHAADRSRWWLPARGRPPRWSLPAGALVASVLLAAGVGWASGRSAVPRAAAVPPLAVSPTAVSPTGVSPTGVSPTGVSVTAVSPSAVSLSPGASAGPLVARVPVAPVGAPRPPSALPSGAAPSAPSGPSAPPVPLAWAAVLDGLDTARAHAFDRADPAALQAVWASGSAGLAADTRAVLSLDEARQHAVGLRHQLRDVRVEQVGPATVRLVVVDVLRAYEVRDRSGQVVRQVAERGSTTFRVALARGPAGWRIVTVTPG